MYNKIECVTLSCDNCGETYRDEHTGFSIFVDEDGARDYASNDDWHLHNGKHYCPNCYDIDDNDNLIIKPFDWIIKEDNICPATKKQCDDECCPVGAVCNLKSTVLSNDIESAPSAQ